MIFVSEVFCNFAHISRFKWFSFCNQKASRSQTFQMNFRFRGFWQANASLGKLKGKLLICHIWMGWEFSNKEIYLTINWIPPANFPLCSYGAFCTFYACSFRCLFNYFNSYTFMMRVSTRKRWHNDDVQIIPSDAPRWIIFRREQALFLRKQKNYYSFEICRIGLVSKTL